MNTNLKNVGFSRGGQGGTNPQGIEQTNRIVFIQSFRLALLLVILPLTGCVSTQSIVTGAAHPALAPEAVRVYAEAPAGSEQVALLTASAGQGYATAQTTMNLVLKTLKEQAAKLGANGIVIISSDIVNTTRAGVGYVNANSGLFFSDSTPEKTTKVQAKAIYAQE